MGIDRFLEVPFTNILMRAAFSNTSTPQVSILPIIAEATQNYNPT